MNIDEFISIFLMGAGIGILFHTFVEWLLDKMCE